LGNGSGLDVIEYRSNTCCSLAASNSASIMTEKNIIDLALSFPGTESCLHFDRIGFKIVKKRMFATYLDKNNSVNIFLTPQEQKVFCKMNAGIYAVQNKWGEKGATTFELDKVAKEILTEALLSAYNYNLLLNSVFVNCLVLVARLWVTMPVPLLRGYGLIRFNH
jgi:hypothetical protein